MYVSKLNSEGECIWRVERYNPDNRESIGRPRVAADPSGAALISYIFGTPAPLDTIYFQKVTSEGNWLFSDKGPLVFPELGLKYQWDREIVSDDSGGAIIAVVAGKKYFRGDTIYVQRIDSDGNLLWGKTGIRVNP
ncbi:hypothetical protein ACFLTS_03925 [Chloroflexota bacterium]